MKKNGLPKQERLCGEKTIKQLFSAGKTVFQHPFKLQYMPIEAGSPQILVMVPKRHFKKAVDRNLVKRRIREAYRLHKGTLPPLALGFLYIGKTVEEYAPIEAGMKKALKKLAAVLSSS